VSTAPQQARRGDRSHPVRGAFASRILEVRWCAAAWLSRGRERVGRSRPSVGRGVGMPSVRPRMTGLSWLEKSILDLSGNALQPILGTKSAVLKMPKVRLHFLDAVFGCSKLQRKAMCDTQCAAAVLFRGICRLLKQPHYGLSGIIQRVAPSELAQRERCFRIGFGHVHSSPSTPKRVCRFGSIAL
jgi:hypothetical protein